MQAPVPIAGSGSRPPPSTRPGMSRKARERRNHALLHIGLIIYFTVSLMPFVWTFLTSLKQSRDVAAAPLKIFFQPTLDNYRAVLFNQYSDDSALARVRVDIPGSFMNSLIIAGGATLLAMLLGNIAAFALARYKMPEREVYAFFFLAFRFAPVFVFIIPMFLIYQEIGLYNTHLGMILISQVIAIPLIVWVMRSFYESIPPELFDSAALDGATRMQMLRQIALPLAAPGLAATAVLAFIACWNNFVFPFLLGAKQTQTITLATITFIGYEEVAWGMMTAAAIVTIVPELILAMLVQKHIVRGLTYGAVKE
ncbi:MAG: carbohydrate ABC transporter permease [Chloroflexota bacterium]|nr:carbohydrate ABC transporter permease [Chloroflexota bacterium]